MRMSSLEHVALSLSFAGPAIALDYGFSGDVGLGYWSQTSD